MRGTLLILVILQALPAPAPAQPDLSAEEQRFAALRNRMVREQITSRGEVSARVLGAMGEVPRHRFVPDERRADSYDDKPLRIGESQTIPQPYMVAVMASLLDLDADDKVLEVGTGSGYQAAVLSRLADEVLTIEIVETLGRNAESSLGALGYDNVRVRIGDGTMGWPEEAPFDAVLVTAAPERIPDALIDQLKVGGKMVIPVGGYIQDLYLVTKTADGYTKKRIRPVRMVPMKGEIEGGGEVDDDPGC